MVYFALVIGWILASVAVSQNATKVFSGKMGLMPGTKAPRHECLKTSSDPQGCAVNQFRNNEGCCLDCPAGSKGNNCSDVCPEEYFGLNCVSKCNCKEDQKCDKIQGCIRTEKDVDSDNDEATISVSNTPQRISYESDYNDKPDTTSYPSVYQTSTHLASQTVETTVLMREEDNMLDVIKPFMIYIVSAIIFLIVVNVCCCVAINRYLSEKRIMTVPSTDILVDEVGSNELIHEREPRPISQSEDGDYAEVIEAQSIYEDLADDEYHMLSFSRKTRVDNNPNASIYHHLDINMFEKEKENSPDIRSSASIEETPNAVFGIVYDLNAEGQICPEPLGEHNEQGIEEGPDNSSLCSFSIESNATENLSFLT